ncbi:DNA replication and repair protein RecF [Breoghania corrubedonensis]|uniref:DNA replication and repair protein RecF n=1 Tax=Breoghania corrubedonensis TaxID=665038 RepID=A0A2T5VG83_9HYPH|nr:DNA replication/repair protein RecF [Breoghania corrubedonensis]PTW62773.1 DNA replication and repair protein RecF [Breoghania corrubedonensis]
MPTSVRLTRLTLTDFRNYASASMEIDARLVALTGDNGAGKTNLLEAISLLTPGRGLRRAAFADIVQKARRDNSHPDGWSVAAVLENSDGETRLGTGFSFAAASRRIRIDATDARAAEELSQYVRVLWLVPAMDGLFTGPAGDRRRFLDRLVLAVDPGHGRRVADFEKAMRSRNRLLETGGEAAWLDAVEAQIASLGVAMALARREAVTLLSGLIGEHAGGDAFPRAALALEGPFEELAALTPAVDLEDAFADQMARGRPRDRAAGRTLDGPHRTDLAVTHVAKGMPAGLASTGEQKALLIGLVLAHAELTARVSGMTPVLLLDEVAAHLDPSRRAALFARLDALGGQVFMTGTDKALFEALPDDAQRFTVSEGTVQGID